MSHSLWVSLLYQPLFNLLIYIYNTVAFQNLGWAVICLTLLLRLILLPFTLLAEKNKERNARVLSEANAAVKMYKNDPVAQKQELRKIMQKKRVSPWASSLTLVVQVVVFIVLYQVFNRGISNEKIAPYLYSSVQFPGIIDTHFYGFEIGASHTAFWPLIIVTYLVVSIVMRFGRRGWKRSDLFYLVFFPLFVFIFLWSLPMVKSLFVLTSLVFSDTVRLAFFFINLGKNSSIEAKIDTKH